MRRLPTPLVPLLLATLAAGATEASALTDLLAAKTLVAKNAANPSADKLVFKYVKDPGLFTLANPLCPATSKIQIWDSGALHSEIALDCNNWSVAGSGYKYRETPAGAGSLRKINYRLGRLLVTIKGPPYSSDPITGPVSFIETRVTIGGTDYCGRFEAPPSKFRKNSATSVVAKGPTVPCDVTCGNSVIEAGELCDDGDLVSGDGCDANCTPTGCGNGIVTAGEACDDGDTENGDGCRSDCTVELCGDGILDPNEECDDGNLVGGDCCSPTCEAEPDGASCADDGNACTDDVCDAGVCAHPNNTAPCDDGNGCTLNDSCSGGVCGGELRLPWINEIDYDSNDGFPNNDRDEFLEIAGPAGLDLGGYRVVIVEGSGSGCLTGFQNAGTDYVNQPIPPGTVLNDDTGTGIGFLTVCFTDTSTNVGAACDVILPGAASDSNLKNGHLTNADLFSCPDGVLLLDPQSDFVDGLSYEGIVANTGTFGPYFHPPFINPVYMIERDEGWLPKVSIERTTSHLTRAVSAAEWRDPTETGTCSGQGGGIFGFLCASNTATPGAENPLQNLSCGSPCEAFIDAGPDGLLD